MIWSDIEDLFIILINAHPTMSIAPFSTKTWYLVIGSFLSEKKGPLCQTLWFLSALHLSKNPVKSRHFLLTLPHCPLPLAKWVYYPLGRDAMVALHKMHRSDLPNAPITYLERKRKREHMPLFLIYNICRTLYIRNLTKCSYPDLYISCFSLRLYLYPARLQHESYDCSHLIHRLPGQARLP